MLTQMIYAFLTTMFLWAEHYIKSTIYELVNMPLHDDVINWIVESFPLSINCSNEPIRGSESASPSLIISGWWALLLQNVILKINVQSC